MTCQPQREVMFRNEFSKLQRMEQKGGELNGLVEKVLSNFEKKKTKGSGGGLVKP